MEAHDDLLSAVYWAQADALKIEAMAKLRLADEYDAAQERGEIGKHGGDRRSDDFKFENSKLDLSPSDIHEARLIRDAEQNDPRIVRRAVGVISGDTRHLRGSFPYNLLGSPFEEAQ